MSKTQPQRAEQTAVPPGAAAVESADDLFQANPLQERTVPFRGRTYRLVEVTPEAIAALEDQLEDEATGKLDVRQWREWMIALHLRTAAGDRVLQGQAAVDRLTKEAPAALIKVLYDACDELSLLSAKARERLGNGSDADRSAASAGGSGANSSAG